MLYLPRSLSNIWIRTSGRVSQFNESNKLLSELICCLVRARVPCENHPLFYPCNDNGGNPLLSGFRVCSFMWFFEKSKNFLMFEELQKICTESSSWLLSYMNLERIPWTGSDFLYYLYASSLIEGYFSFSQHSAVHLQTKPWESVSAGRNHSSVNFRTYLRIQILRSAMWCWFTHGAVV